MVDMKIVDSVCYLEQQCTKIPGISRMCYKKEKKTAITCSWLNLEQRRSSPHYPPDFIGILIVDKSYFELFNYNLCLIKIGSIYLLLPYIMSLLND